jgi:hypothetical protein
MAAVDRDGFDVAAPAVENTKNSADLKVRSLSQTKTSIPLV